MANVASAVPGRGRLPTRSRDRRGALSALALLLVVAGALGAALVVYRSGQRTDVLVSTHEIKAGTKVSSSDFTTVRVAADSGSVVRAADEGNFLGSYATTDIPSGTLVNRLMFQAANVIPGNGVVVGVTLSREQRPATSIQSGDILRVYTIPKQGSTDAAAANPVLIDAARVVSASSGSSSSDTITISLLVTNADASALVVNAGAGSVAVAELPRTTKPVIDFQHQS